MGEKLDRFFKKAGEVFGEFAPVLLEMLYTMQQAVERQQREQEERERNRREARSVDINNRRAEMRGLPATLTVVEWLTILDYFDWKCAYCKDSPYEELEHIIPLNHGTAGTTKENCRPSCRACNAVKGRHHPDLLKQVSEGIERVRSEQSLLYDIE